MGKRKQDTSKNNHVQSLSATPSKVNKSKKKDPEGRIMPPFSNGYIALVVALGKGCIRVCEL